LGPAHPFGREIKATVLGNPNPYLHISYAGGQTAATTPDVFVKAVITVRTHGVGIIHGLN
jgi:hypothetical protein